MPRRTLVAVLFVALALVSACSSDGGSDGPSASVSPPTSAASSTSSSVARTPEQEVEAAYLRSWDVYAKAVRELDPSGLEESYTGTALQTVRDEVAGYKAARTPLVVQVEHQAAVMLIDPRSAVVRDRYVNRNYRIDEKGAPIDPTDAPEVFVDVYSMVSEGGRWRVARMQREAP